MSEKILVQIRPLMDGSLKTNADNALAFHSFNGQLTLDMRQEICHSCEPCVGPISPNKLDP